MSLGGGFEGGSGSEYWLGVGGVKSEEQQQCRVVFPKANNYFLFSQVSPRTSFGFQGCYFYSAGQQSLTSRKWKVNKQRISGPLKLGPARSLKQVINTKNIKEKGMKRPRR